jgi:hypothetical protein
VTRERTSTGFTQPVIANDINKASLQVNRLERHAGKLARAVLRGGGDGDTASLPDRPLRSRFRQQLKRGVDMTSNVKGFFRESEDWCFSLFISPTIFISLTIGREGASHHDG